MPYKKILYSLYRIVAYPFSLVYAGIMYFRRAYIQRYYPIYIPPLPVIAVGNIAMGGTGKTPLTSHILSIFEKHNLKAIVFSRGYGGTAKKFPIMLNENTPVELVGDEPTMLALLHPLSAVVVDPNRMRAIQYALKKSAFTICILDDAMQHIYVRRDANIVVLTINDICTWNYVLPAGRWREGKSALHHASIFCIRATESEWQEYKNLIYKKLLHFQKPIYSFVMEIDSLRSINTNTPITITNKQPYSIVCGIGTPLFFYKDITQYMGYAPSEYYFCKDHATQTELEEALQKCTNLYRICTAKDAVKLRTSSIARDILYTETRSIITHRYTPREEKPLSFEDYCLKVAQRTI